MTISKRLLCPLLLSVSLGLSSMCSLRAESLLKPASAILLPSATPITDIRKIAQNDQNLNLRPPLDLNAPSADPASNFNSDPIPSTNSPMQNGNEFAGANNMPSVPGLEQIKLRDINLVRRDLINLAVRHGQAIPDAALTRQQLGKYFFDMMNKLASMPQGKFSEEDYNDIGILTDDFDDVLRRVKGRMALSVLKNEFMSAPKTADAEKTKDLDSRLAILEKVKLSGDFTFAPQSDFGRKTADATAANFRGRINVLAKVYESKADSKIGDSSLFMRLTAASGRFFPLNRYLMSPTNALNDANANPFNSGVNDVQIPNLQINNNNSNNVRPTVAFEQMYFSQDFRPSKQVKAKLQIGLNNIGNMFDANNYANNETSQFLNTQFVNSTAFKTNFIGPSSIFSLERGILRDRAFLRATSALITLADRDVFGGFSTIHEVQLGHKFFKKEGNIRGGFWNFNFRGGNPRPLVTPTNLSPPALLAILPGGSSQGSQPVGFYLNADQKIWKDIGLFGRYANGDNTFGQVFLGGLLTNKQSFSFGAEIPMKIITKKRPDDVIGIAYGQISSYRRGTITPSTPAFVALDGVPATTLDQVNANLAVLSPGRRPAQEKCIEAYYRWQVNKNVSISPDFQYIFSPGATAGGNPGICVLGTRLNVVF